MQDMVPVSPRPLWPRRAAEVLLVVGVSGLLFGVLKPYSAKRDGTRCQEQLKRIGLAMSWYVRDYDEMFPMKHNWQEAIFPYGKWTFQCPNEKVSYVFNSRLAGINMTVPDNLAQIASNYETLMPVQVDDGSAWQLPGIHPQGNNVLYMDGHVKAGVVKPPFTSFLIDEWWKEVERQRLEMLRRKKEQDKKKVLKRPTV